MAIVIKKLQELKIETVTPQELLPELTKCVYCKMFYYVK